MPKFGAGRMGEQLFGATIAPDRPSTLNELLPPLPYNRTHRRWFLGQAIHGQFGGRCTAVTAGTNARFPTCWHRTTALCIYRNRRGNGYAGSLTNRRYQDLYSYTIPTSITNTEGASARNIFAQGVSAWQVLPENEKESWRAQEKNNPQLLGYNIFMREYMRANY